MANLERILPTTQEELEQMMEAQYNAGFADGSDQAFMLGWDTCYAEHFLKAGRTPYDE
jgi:hypothetical protein